MEQSFAEILSTRLQDIESLKALPTGTYLCLVEGQPEITKAGQKFTDCVIFNFKPLQAQDDVDQSQLRDVLNGQALQDRKIKYTMFVTGRSKHHIAKFLRDDLGIDATFSLRQSIDEAIGKQVYVRLTHESSKTSDAVYENVASTRKV